MGAPGSGSCSRLLRQVSRPADRVIVSQSEDKDESIHGTTWGDVQGFQGLTRMRLGSDVTKADLEEDWTMTHELVHMALSSLPDESHWLEEGIATYVEPLARVQAGQLPVEQVWAGMVRGMPQGEPQPGDKGLDQTHTWGRTYWGGAMFCLVADVQIRKATGNRKGLQDALQAIMAAQGTIDTEWPVQRVLETGDDATETTVLVDLYRKWKDGPGCGGPRSTLATAGCASRFPRDRTGCERPSRIDS